MSEESANLVLIWISDLGTKALRRKLTAWELRWLISLSERIGLHKAGWWCNIYSPDIVINNPSECKP